MSDENNKIKKAWGPEARKPNITTHERASELGKRSAEVRLEKKTLREHLKLALELSLPKDTLPNDLQKLIPDGSYLPIKDGIALAMIIKATKGDVRAAEFIRDSIGEKPKDEIEFKQLSVDLSDNQLLEIIDIDDNNIESNNN